MFKTKQLTLMLAAALMFLGACNNKEDLLPDDPEQQQSVPAPIIEAQMGQTTHTRAGVVEGNANYADGENFRWDGNEEVTMKFYQGTTLKNTVTYVAGTPNATNLNLCTFTPKTTASITTGTPYNIYGVYATPITSPTSNNVTNLTQSGNNSSAHLSGNLLMKGKVLSATVSEASPTLSMRFNHLTSVVRYVLTNNTGNANLTVKSITISSSTTPFAQKAYLNGIDAQTLTLSSKVNAATLTVTNGAFDDNTNTFHGFTRVVTGSDAFTDLTVSVTVDNNGAEGMLSKTLKAEALGILAEGFKPGHSYYFRMGITADMGLDVSAISDWNGMEDEPTEGEIEFTYSIGDYYPNPTNPKTAIGVVFWVDPKDARHGKIVGLEETSFVAWVNVSGLGDTQCTNMYNGVSNMNILWNLKSSYDNYPAFYKALGLNEGSASGNIYANATTGVWYLPAIEELRALAAGYNGLVYENITNWKLLDAMPGHQSGTNHRSAFHQKIIDAGGVGFSNSTNIKYWSSTEHDRSNAYSIGIHDGDTSSTVKTTSYTVRFIMAF